MSPSATSTTPIQPLAIGRSRVTSFTPFFPLGPYSPRHAPSTVEAQLLLSVWVEHNYWGVPNFCQTKKFTPLEKDWKKTAERFKL